MCLLNLGFRPMCLLNLGFRCPVNEDFAHMLPDLFYLVNMIGEDNEIKIKLLIKLITYVHFNINFNLMSFP